MTRSMARSVLGSSIALFDISRCHGAMPLHFSPSVPRSSPARIEGVMADYARAQTALVAKARAGARADVTMLIENGSVHWGYDIFYSTPEPKIKEIRDDRTSMQVGDIACTRQREERRYDCRKVGALHLGLFDIDETTIVKVWSIDIACPADAKRHCRFIKVRMRGANTAEDIDLVNTDYEVLIDRATYLPIYLRQTNHGGIGVVGMAVYQFDFKGKVEPFTLPVEAARLKSP